MTSSVVGSPKRKPKCICYQSPRPTTFAPQNFSNTLNN
jgi:hypothetical protein